MNFSTPVNIPQYSFTIQHQQRILLCGSCFSENIGKKLTEAKFKSSVNPFGIIYNPVSLAKTLKRIIENHHYTIDELYSHDGKWLSWDHHGEFSSFDPQTTLHNINDNITLSNQQLGETNTIVLTLGSAWVYELKGTSNIVANCHKVPASFFQKRLLTIKEVVEAISEIIECLPDIKFIFTVSPVRHIKDGLHENNLSKGILHAAMHQLVEQYANGVYFPAYEIVVDELRDYRFYKEDMAHPNQQAIDYVWEKFSGAFFNKETTELIQKIEKLQKAVQHKPFNFDSDQHQAFIKKQLSFIDKLSREYPELNFENERELLMREK